MREIKQLSRHNVLEPMNARYTVAHGHHSADLAHADGAIKVFNLLADNTGYFVWFNFCHVSMLSPASKFDVPSAANPDGPAARPFTFSILALSTKSKIRAVPEPEEKENLYQEVVLLPARCLTPG